jgi:hypothetical protein
MKMRHRLIPFALLAATIIGVCPLRGQDFYELRLRAGQEAYRSGHAADAVDDFRIAAFGFLDRPRLLSEAFVWLTVAESSAGKTAEVEAALARFLDVERRFGTYDKLKLEPDIRKAFEAILTKRELPATLRAIPSLAPLAEEKK